MGGSSVVCALSMHARSLALAGTALAALCLLLTSCSDDAGTKDDGALDVAGDEISPCCTPQDCGPGATCEGCACVPLAGPDVQDMADLSTTDISDDTSDAAIDIAGDFQVSDAVDDSAGDMADMSDVSGPTAIDITWPDTSANYKFDVAVYLTSLQVPALDERNAPTCCKDFGAISKDSIVAGTDGVDNGLAVLFMDRLSTIIDTNGALDTSIQSGGFVQIFEHKLFSGVNDADGFVLTALPGRFEGSTTYAEGAAGLGTFSIDPIAFEPGSGRPATVFNPSQMTNGELTTTTSTFYLTIPLGGAAINVPMQEAEVFGHAFESATPDGKLSLNYVDGWIGGYIYLSDFREAINTYIESECGCLALTAPLYGNTAQWEPNECMSSTEALALCPNPTLNETGCINLVAGLNCALLPGLLRSEADIDPDGQGYSAISGGFEFTAVPATVTGIAN